MISESMTPEEFAAIANVSRETLSDLSAYVTLLEEWNKSLNLVGSNSLTDVWRRHILDSAQIADHIPHGAKTLIDLGSGAGLPGLVLAILIKNETGPHVSLIESSSRKCAFLRTAAQRLDVDVTVLAKRAEDIEPAPADVVSARALAPLFKLLELAEPFVGSNSRCLFLKGRHFEAELTEATKYWNMTTTRIPSKSDPSSRILCLEGICRV